MIRYSITTLCMLTALSAPALAGSDSVHVSGQVTRGPLAPVERPGEVNQTGFATTVSMTGADGRNAGSVQTDEHGIFQTDLAPGTYTFQAECGDNMPGGAKPVTVDIKNGVEPVEVVCDTGIR